MSAVVTWRLLALAGVLTAAPLSAQTAYLGGGGATGRLRLAVTDGSAALTGPLAAAELGASMGIVTVTGRYVQGSLTGGGVSSSFVGGEAVLSLSPVPWLAIGAGPAVFSFTNGAREQWSFLVGHVRAAAPLVGDGVRSYIEARRSLDGYANLPGGPPSEAGAAIGLILGPPGGPIGLRFGYEIDRIAVTGGTERVVERLGLAVQFGRRRL